MPATICVTGAGGFIASWLVKYLLERGYNVRGTIRGDPPAHLTSLPHAKERLTLYKADLLTPGSFDHAFAGCDGVFHTASPFFFQTKDPENELLKPAIEGTLSVLNSAYNTPSVKRVIVTSSTAAVMIGNYDTNHEFVEDDWSDAELLKMTKQWYLLSKTLAERAVWDFYNSKPK